eukprot:jgi/Chrzof1/6740/Cz19g07110.t1
MALPSHQYIPIRGKKAGFPTLQNPTHAGCSKCLPSSRLCFGWVGGRKQSKLASCCCCCLKAKLYHVHPGIYTVHTPPKTQPNHVSLAISHSHFDHTWHNPQFELTAQLKYLWPNLRLNSKSNPLFKTIQIDLYDPLRIQHESLRDHL